MADETTQAKPVKVIAESGPRVLFRTGLWLRWARFKGGAATPDDQREPFLAVGNDGKGKRNGHVNMTAWVGGCYDVLWPPNCKGTANGHTCGAALRENLGEAFADGDWFGIAVRGQPGVIVFCSRPCYDAHCFIVDNGGPR